jgi:hypothetical protein
VGSEINSVEEYASILSGSSYLSLYIPIRMVLCTYHSCLLSCWVKSLYRFVLSLHANANVQLLSNPSLQLTLLTYLLTYLRSWALLEESPIVQPLKNFPASYGTRRFNTVFTPIPYMHSSSPHSCYIPRPSHPSWLDHSNYTLRRVQVMNYNSPLAIKSRR